MLSAAAAWFICCCWALTCENNIHAIQTANFVCVCVCVIFLMCFQENSVSFYFGSREVRQVGGNGYYVFHQYPAFTCQQPIKPDMVTHTQTHTLAHTRSPAGTDVHAVIVLSQFSLDNFEKPKRLTELKLPVVRHALWTMDHTYLKIKAEILQKCVSSPHVRLSQPRVTAPVRGEGARWSLRNQR